MSYRFDDAFRREVARRCAAFSRLPADAASARLKRAAIALTLVEADDGSGEVAFLLTRRADGLRRHRGQYALPGGRCDEGETPTEAALRELDEDLGVRLPANAVLGLIDDYPSRSGYLITPVVVWGGRGVALAPNPDEVAVVHRVPLADIARPEVVDFITIPESPRRVIRIRMVGDLIHAHTAAVLYQFVELVAGPLTRFADLEQPVFAWS